MEARQPEKDSLLKVRECEQIITLVDDYYDSSYDEVEAVNFYSEGLSNHASSYVKT